MKIAYTIIVAMLLAMLPIAMNAANSPAPEAPNLEEVAALSNDIGDIVSHEYETIYNKGVKLYDNGDYMQALYQFQQAIPLSPADNSNALTHAGLACMSLNWYASAIDYLNEAVNVSATFFAVSSLANAYADLGDDSKSLYYNNMVLNTDPSFDVSLNNVGITYFDRGNFDKALDSYRKAMNSKSNFIPSLHNIGVLYNYTENTDSAIFYYQKVLAIDPKVIESNIGMIEILQEQGKPASEYQQYSKTILEETSKTIKKNPQDYKSLKDRAFVYKNMGNTKAMKKDLDQSLAILDKLLNQHPDSYVFLALRADVYDMLGDKEKATADYQRVLSYMPNHPDAVKYMKKS